MTDMWILYEAAARGIARGRLGRRYRDSNPDGREPTNTERMWAKLAVDEVIEYLGPLAAAIVTGPQAHLESLVEAGVLKKAAYSGVYRYGVVSS